MGHTDGSTPATDHVRAEVRSVRTLLEFSKVAIPDYQRPYKWTVQHVAQLIGDIAAFRDQGPYRIGTVILHDNNGRLEIVDGQQRFVTFCLITYALRAIQDQIKVSVPDVGRHELGEHGVEVSRTNVLTNYDYLAEALGRLEDVAGWADFFLHNCELVVLTLDDVDEAFQMFDSQNTRGRPLFPTDLLKAYHIREMSAADASAELKLAMVQLWEQIPPESVNKLFSDYLFKIKRWANGRSVPVDGFASEHVGMFKGIREQDPRNAQNRWAMPYLYAKNYTDDFGQENATLIRYGAFPAVEYPYQIDQPVINGETFFMMVRHYYDLGRRYGLFEDDPEPVPTEPGAADMIGFLGVHRRNPTYRLVRNLFDCLLLYYADRFGNQDLGQASHFIARYAMTKRVERVRVTRQMIDNYALGRDSTVGNLFGELREAMRSDEFLQQVLPAPELRGYEDLHSLYSRPSGGGGA